MRNLLNKINSDYMINDAKKILKLRSKINNFKNTGIIKKIIKKIQFIRYQKICKKNNAFISVDTVLDENTICFPHGISGIFISGGAQIGNNCTIFQQVTIGSNTLSDSKGKGAPIIGDDVFIGAGAKIIGNVKIGNNVRIGAGAIVVKDIEDNSTVVMSGCKVIKHSQKRNNNFVSYKNNK